MIGKLWENTKSIEQMQMGEGGSQNSTRPLILYMNREHIDSTYFSKDNGGDSAHLAYGRHNGYDCELQKKIMSIYSIVPRRIIYKQIN